MCLWKREMDTSNNEKKWEQKKTSRLRKTTITDTLLFIHRFFYLTIPRTRVCLHYTQLYKNTERNCATKESLVDFSWEVDEILFPVNMSEIYCDTSATAIKTGFPYLICMSVLRVVHGIMSHERNYYGICINHELDNTYCTMQKYFYCLNSNWWYVFDFLYFFILNVNFNKI